MKFLDWFESFCEVYRVQKEQLVSTLELGSRTVAPLPENAIHFSVSLGDGASRRQRIGRDGTKFSGQKIESRHRLLRRSGEL